MMPREINPPPSITEIIKNRSFWKNKILHFRGRKIVYDQDIRSGICYFCKRDGRPQRTGPRYLHHVKYDDSDPLAWTIEVCAKCHRKIDSKNRKILDRYYGK